MSVNIRIVKKTQKEYFEMRSQCPITFPVFTAPLSLQVAAHAGVPFGSANAGGDSVGEGVYGNILLTDVGTSQLIIRIYYFSKQILFLIIYLCGLN